MYELKFIKSNLFSILVVLLIPSLITGPFIPNLILSLSSVVFLFFIIKKKMWKIFDNIFFYFFFSFCLLCIISSLLSDDILFSLKTSLFYFRTGLFASLISFLISNNKNFVRYLFLSLSISFFLLIVDGYYQYFNSTNLLGQVVPGSWDGTRLSSLFGDELILGSYLSRLLPIFIALYFLKQKYFKFDDLVFFIVFSLVCVLIYLSGERASFVFLFLTLFTLFIFNYNNKYFNLFFLLVLVIIYIFAITNPKLNYRMFKSVLSNDLKIINNENKIVLPKIGEIIIFSDGHNTLIRTAYNMFKDKPILGVGPNMFRMKCSDERYIFDKNKHYCDTHPHNFYIQIAAETGVIGLMLIFLFFFHILYKILKNFFYIFNKKKTHNNYEIFILMSIMITIFPFVTNGNFFNSWLVNIYSIGLGFYINYNYKENNFFKKLHVEK